MDEKLRKKRMKRRVEMEENGQVIGRKMKE